MIVRLRTSIRLASVGAHLVSGLIITLVVYPLVARHTRRRIQQRWSNRLLGIFGVRLAVSGSRPISVGGLLVANHISWLDVFVIGALAPTTFVAKSEVRGWPLIGLLCARAEVVFLERGSRAAALRVNQTLVDKLGNGEQVAVFPEGTTSDGETVLPFRAALLQSAIDSGSAVQPLVLRYLDDQGRNAPAVAYCGETSFWQSLCAISSMPGCIARIEILEKVATREKSRRELAEETRVLIHASLKKSCVSLRDAPRINLLPGRAEKRYSMTPAACPIAHRDQPRR